MRYSRVSIARSAAVAVSSGLLNGCSMIGELDLPGPVLPATLFVILALLGSMFAVAFLRYAHRGDDSGRSAAGRTESDT